MMVISHGPLQAGDQIEVAINDLESDDYLVISVMPRIVVARNLYTNEVKRIRIRDILTAFRD
jgi:hypothetical protein